MLVVKYSLNCWEKGIVMDKRGKIELARAILVKAVNINMDKEVIQRLSEELDKYILEYYQDGEKAGLPTRGKGWE